MARTQNYYHLICFVALSFFLLGVNRCQEDYEFGQQADGLGSSPSPSASPSASVSPSPSSSEEASPSPEDSVSPEVSPSPTETTQETSGAFFSRSFLREVSEESSKAAEDEERTLGSKDSIEISSLTDLAGGPRTEPENWLGELSVQDSLEEGSAVLDSDDDGYADFLEDDFGSDKQDPQSVPPAPVTKLRARLAKNDLDFDGLTDKEELAQGTNPANSDSDGDGFIDSAEVLSGTRPMDPSSTPNDSDGDGLSDHYENALGLNPNAADTDGDRLSDGYEATLKSDPLSSDTDKDGILDWREVLLGSDPIIPEKLG